MSELSCPASPSIELQLSGLDEPAQLCWLFLAERFLELCPKRTRLVADPAGVGPALLRVLTDGGGFAWNRLQLTPVKLSEGQAFAMTSGAAGMLPGLVLNPGRLVIRPHDMPGRVAEVLFWSVQLDSSGVAALLEQASALGEDARRRVEKWLTGLVAAKPRVTLISSVFDADRFTAHFLGNMASLAGYQDCQHLLIRAGSPGSEHDQLLQHADDHPGAVYINLPQDPGLYETWNMAACLASGRYLSNANVDDRRHPDHLSTLVNLLDGQLESDVASSALGMTETPNQNWAESDGLAVWYGDQDEFDYPVSRLLERHRGGKLVARNRPHCMPLWRRSLHLLHGFFNEQQYGPSADWEFWLRCGEAGSRFSRVARPLGLYLKHPDSYWRRDEANRRFDERIKLRYEHVLDECARMPQVQYSAWRDLERFRHAGNWLGVFACLQRLHDGSDGQSVDLERRRELVERRFLQWFGPGQTVEQGLGQMREPACDSIHRIEKAVLARALAFGESEQLLEPAVWQRWLRLLVDLHRVSDRATPLVALAWLVRRRGHGEDWVEIEQRLLQAACEADPRGFWRMAQQVYRFELTLDELVDRTRDIQRVGNDTRPAGGRQLRLVYFPSYSNKYQELLYWGLQRDGAKVEGVRTVAELAGLQPLPNCKNLVHLHWLNAVFERPDLSFNEAASGFLKAVAALQRRGFQVFWTVHNRLSHDSEHPLEESRFRAELAHQVDRVYLHHPLLQYELDWLPDEVEPWLCEHGPYVEPASGGIDRGKTRDRLEIPHSARVFLWFGQIRPYKALEEHLPAMVKALQEHPQSLLIVAGKSSSSHLRELLKSAGEQIRYVNRHISSIELQYLANAADFGILTYHDILTSGAMFHMYCTGLPVIAPDLGALAGYVVPEWNGYLYRDVDELGQIMKCMYLKMDDELELFSENARKTAAHFQWGRVV